jgi:hypothetical protein
MTSTIAASASRSGRITRSARADGAFIAEHYWSHCDRGGHPSAEGMPLLPDHSWQTDAAFVWVDLAGHLVNIWRRVMAVAEIAHGQPIDAEAWKLPDVDEAIETWLASDLLYAAFRSSATQGIAGSRTSTRRE